MRRFWGIITLLFIGFIAIGTMVNSTGASKVLGTLFSGTASLGSVLEGKGSTTVSS
jgi:di/tricarboxylate transporter